MAEYSGGSVDYYKLYIKKPATLPEPYEAECDDIIVALQLNWHEANIFKALWRKGAARKGKSKVGHNDKYDNEKILFFAELLNRD